MEVKVNKPSACLGKALKYVSERDAGQFLGEVGGEALAVLLVLPWSRQISSGQIRPTCHPRSDGQSPRSSAGASRPRRTARRTTTSSRAARRPSSRRPHRRRTRRDGCGPRRRRPSAARRRTRASRSSPWRPRGRIPQSPPWPRPSWACRARRPRRRSRPAARKLPFCVHGRRTHAVSEVWPLSPAAGHLRRCSPADQKFRLCVQFAQVYADKGFEIGIAHV